MVVQGCSRLFKGFNPDGYREFKGFKVVQGCSKGSIPMAIVSSKTAIMNLILLAATLLQASQ